MVKYVEVNIGTMPARQLETYTFNEDVEIIKLEGEKLNADLPDLSLPGRINTPAIILTLAGKATIEINDKTYTILPNTLIDITGVRVFHNFLFSDDYRGYSIMVTNRFYEEIFYGERHLTPDVALRKSTDPLEHIGPTNTSLLVDILEKIIWNISRTSHIWYRRMVMNEVRSFYMEVGNIIVNNLTSAEKEQDLPDNGLLFFKFMQLLQDNSNERKSVGFYADKLCLTPDHFAKNIKAYTGRNVTDWINEALLRQAKLYLQDPESTLQQVADILNFSDQSAFGKFFKKQTGISPGEYKSKKGLM